MANDLGVQFFTDAKAQFDSAGKWRWIILALLAYLHVGLVLPFPPTRAIRRRLIVSLQTAR
jgi:hypothetical protein